MRFVLTSRNATYDETLREYIFELGQPLSNFKKFRILDCSFVLENHTLAPPEIFMRSEKLADNISRGAIREVKKGVNDGLAHSSNVIAYLTENTDKFRYHLKHPIEYEIRRNGFIQRLDFFFTDAEHNKLNMRETQQALTTATDAQIEAIADLLIWTDFTNNNAMTDINNAPVAAEANLAVNHVQDRKQITLKYSLAYGQNGLTCLVGQTVGITRGQNQSWQSFYDGTAWSSGQGVLNDEFHFHTLFMVNNSNDFCVFFLSEFLYIVLYQGVLCIIKNGNDFTNTASLQVLAQTPYILSVKRVNDGNTWNFECRLEAPTDTHNQGIQTDTVEATSQQNLDTAAWNNVRIGAPNTHFAQFQSHMILCNTNANSPTDYDLCIAWLKAKCNGTEQVEEAPSGTESHFSIFAELI
jgi:hypothetical protein